MLNAGVVLAISIGLEFLLFFLIDRRYPKALPPHLCSLWHELVLIEVQHITNDAGTVTIVLKRCERCGAHVTFPLSGKWSLAELSRSRSEIAELERMAR